jgi:uncharacterized protein
MEHTRAIVPRPGPDFGLDGDIPKYWLEGDPFKSRFFDAMSMLFPEGEKFFIACVRDYRDQIADPVLAAQVKDFMYQEGQHGMVHTRFNERLRAQGVKVDEILERQRKILFGTYRGKLPPKYTLAQTAGAEHMTALMAHGFFGRGLLAKADPRIRAMYAWHAIEEIEHKAVAFDVYQKVAKGGYFVRALALLHESVMFPLHVFLLMDHMFKVDGLKGRWKLWIKGLWWLYRPGGVYMNLRVLGHFAAWFLPGFHPWKVGRLDLHEQWTAAYAASGGNAIAAGEVLAQLDGAGA